MPDGNDLLEIRTTDAGVVVSGELDASTAEILAPHLDPLPAGTSDVTIELAAVDFIDSSGLRLLVAAHQRAAEADRRLLLVNPSKAVLRLLDIAGLADHLHVTSGDDG